MINPNTKVVPIDHGWANMKTEQDVYTSGVSEITTEPALFNDVLEYNNNSNFPHQKLLRNLEK